MTAEPQEHQIPYRGEVIVLTQSGDEWRTELPGNLPMTFPSTGSAESFLERFAEAQMRQDFLNDLADERIVNAKSDAEIQRERDEGTALSLAEKKANLARAKELDSDRIEACKRIEAGAREMAEGIKAALNINAEMMTILKGGPSSSLARQPFLKRLSFWLSAIFESATGHGYHFGYLKIVGGRRVKSTDGFADGERGLADGGMRILNYNIESESDDGQ